MEEAKKQKKLLMSFPTTIKQKIHIVNNIIMPTIAYIYYIVPFPDQTLKIRQSPKQANKTNMQHPRKHGKHSNTPFQ